MRHGMNVFGLRARGIRWLDVTAHDFHADVRSVAKGQKLLTLEAMKMEHTLTAPADGKVKSVRYAVGEQVPEGAELVEFE